MKYATLVKMSKFLIRILIMVTCSALLLFSVGCSNLSPHFVVGVTPAPTADSVPTPSPTPTHETENTRIDALGNTIFDADHYKRYLQFADIAVYEENGETFLDCKVINSYPEVLVCGVSVCFYGDDGSLLAVSKLQMPDGSFLLTLGNGETRLFARILTDSTVTDRDFTLVFDDSIGVGPQK